MPNSTLDSVVRQRRSIRRFQGEPIDPAVVEELVDLARWAPSPHNSQPWRFTLLTDGSKQKLGLAMARALRSDLNLLGVDPHIIEVQVTRSLARIDDAPTAILCSIVDEGLKLTGDERLDALETQMAVQSVGAVLQTLFLVAAERGIGACWMAAPMYCPHIVRGSLGLPNEFLPQALVLLGYQAHPERERPRRTVSELMQIS